MAPENIRVLRCRDRALTLGAETVVMGILNVTPDSFSDGGQLLDSSQALGRAQAMIAEGAGLLDIGGQSTRPGYTEISAEEEIARVLPLVRALAREAKVPLSIDTYKAPVARAALEAGAHLLNDQRGLQGDPELAQVARAADCPIVVMHHDPSFRDAPGDVIEKVRGFFEKTFSIAEKNRIPLERLILDPGIGFFKTPAQNLEIVSRLDEICAWGFPVLLGFSRKSTIGQVLDLPVNERLEGTLASTAIAAWLGVDIVRVHDVQANVRAAKMARALRAAHPKFS